MISDTAMRGFGRAAGSYDRGRPEYPPHAIGWLSQRLDLTAEKTVLDVGAGTGKLTGALAGTGVRMIALEPVAEMRTVLEQRVPRAQVLAGTAEQVPLRAGVLDAVVADRHFTGLTARERSKSSIASCAQGEVSA